MHWLAKVALTILGNAFALWLADLLIPGFGIHATVVQLLLIAFVLALLNWILKPILTLIFGPIIILTLGIGILIVNAIILELLRLFADHLAFLQGSITIQTILALVLATVLISIVNLLIHAID